MRKITDEMITQSYNTIVERRGWKDRLGYINLQELYKHLRKNHIKTLTIKQFQDYMLDFWKRKCPDEFSFAHGSSIHKDQDRYGFVVRGFLGGLYYYIRKMDAFNTNTYPK